MMAKVMIGIVIIRFAGLLVMSGPGQWTAQCSQPTPLLLGFTFLFLCIGFDHGLLESVSIVGWLCQAGESEQTVWRQEFYREICWDHACTVL